MIRLFVLLLCLFILSLCLLAFAPAKTPQSFPGRSVPDSNPSNPIRLSLAKTRVADGLTDICVAPCTVFFDASGTTDASVTNYPFHEIQYTWNFGDPVDGAATACGSQIAAGQGFWACGSNAGGNSKNVAYGPIAAHVFETAGTYTATLTAYDGTNTKSTTTIVTVTGADIYFGNANTVCVSSSATYTGCTGTTQVNSADFAAVIATYAVSGKRVLFRRGETFNDATTGIVSAAGPGLIGSYAGIGNTAHITASFATNWTPILRFSTPASDWRVMDLEFDGTSTTASSNGIDIQNGTNITILRAYVHDIGSYSILADPSLHVVDKWAVVDSVMCCMTAAPGATFGIFGGTTNGYAFIAGSSVTLNSGTTQGHSLRLPGASEVVISNNTLDRKNGFTNIDFHGYSAGGVWTGQYADKNTISDNKFIDGTIAVGPQHALADERLKDFIIERNSGYASADTVILQCFTIMSSAITVRNNLCESLFNSPGASLLLVDTRNGIGIGPAPDHVWAYNNSFYTSTNAGATMIQWAAKDSNMVAKNNLAYAPNAVKGFDWRTGGGAPISVYDPGSTTPTTCASCNSSNSQMKGTNPNFANSALKSLTDWKPTSGYAIGGGTLVPVLSDFLFVAEPSPRDIGAVVH